MNVSTVGEETTDQWDEAVPHLHNGAHYETAGRLLIGQNHLGLIPTQERPFKQRQHLRKSATNPEEVQQ